MAFIFIGKVNVLAPIVTINFMLTYSFIDYSYFSVSMTFQLQNKEKAAKTNRYKLTQQSSRPLIEATLPNYGSGGQSSVPKGTLLEFTKDMNQIFPPTSNFDAGADRISTKQEPSGRFKNRKSSISTKQKLMDSFGLDQNSNMFSGERREDETEGQPEGDVESLAAEELQDKCISEAQDSSTEPHDHSKGVTITL